MKINLKHLLLASLPFLAENGTACDACKKQQPKLLQGITHGPGPESRWDYLIVTVMVAITLYIFIATLRRLFRPAERNSDHIKRTILNELTL